MALTIQMNPVTSTARRTEKDSMGERQLPDSVYYGIQTARALDNFSISGIHPLPIYVDACVSIKKAAAKVNAELGCIPQDIAEAIATAADEIVKERRLRDQFVVDIYQAGAGTSHHMNVNEVLANRALEILGDVKGNYQRVSPNDIVNYGQSTNDVIPTAIRFAALVALHRDMLPAMLQFAAALTTKAEEFQDVIKSGRTHLQDAVPVRLGDTFRAAADIASDHARRLQYAATDLQIIGLGGSAAGTGLNAHPDYCAQVAIALTQCLADYLTPIQPDIALTPADNLMAAMQSMAPFASVSSALRNFALDLTKIANDLRLMDSGPKTGLKEIQLPPVQPGSSIMPGKYNPVMAEMTNMVCYQVMGLDAAIAACAQAGQFELNVMMPLIAYDLLHAIQISANALKALTQKCIFDIEANRDRCRTYAEGSLALVTALNPHIGYLEAARVARTSLATGKTIREVAIERQLMTASDLDRVLDLADMSQPHPRAPISERE
ncbi:MAG: aspartate ammonia-lyase [Cyanobacteria bacterium J06639_1]